MELAGIVGRPQEGVRPDLLKQILVKDQEASAQQPGKAVFWVYTRIQETVVPPTVLAEPQGQCVQAVPDNRPPKASAGKQPSITDFFSPRPARPLANVPVLDKEKSRCVMREEVASKSSSSSSKDEPATELIGTSQAEKMETDEAKETEKYWIEKDEERLAVIADMKKTMAKMEGELANTVTAFQMASDTNQKLQTQLERKTTSLSQVEEDMSEVVHGLNAADMSNEQLKKDLAQSREDRTHQFDRAEEAMALIEADPSKDAIANLLQAKAEAESRNLSKQREMESEIDTLNSQLKERCDSVARLTENLSRVADSDRWVDVKKELNEMWERADNLPEDLRIALHECKNWKDQYHALQDSQEEELRKRVREVRRQCKEDTAKLERDLRGCLKQVFERMVRCTLCLEVQGLLPFDEKHSAICKQVFKLAGEDYQQPLLEYYKEHDIQEEFEDDLEDDYEDNRMVYDVDSDNQARNEEPNHQEKGQEQNGGDVNVHTTNFSSGPADTTHDLSSTPTPATMEVDSVTTTDSKPKDQVLSKHENTVPVPAASTKPESSKNFTFSRPIFTSQQAEASTAASSNDAENGMTSAFVFGKSFPPPFFGTPVASNIAESTEGSVSPGLSRYLEPKEATSSSSAGKGSSQNIWGGTSFPSAENQPSFQAEPAEALEPKSKETFPPTMTSKPAALTTPASENPEAKPGSGAIKAQEEIVPSTTEKANIFRQPGIFNFGGVSGPVSFTASSSFIPAQVTPPTSTGNFSFPEQNSPSVTVQPIEEAGEVNVSKGKSSKEGVPKTEVLKDTSLFPPQSVTPYLHNGLYHPAQNFPESRNLGEEMSKEDLPMEDMPKVNMSEHESLPKEYPTEKIQKELPRKAKSAPREQSAPKDVPASAPTPSEPSRKERKAAKKAEDKAAQKAKNEARNVKAEERRRVEKAMMMK